MDKKSNKMKKLHFLEICPFSRTAVLIINELNLECKLIAQTNLYNINQKSLFYENNKLYYMDFPYLTEDEFEDFKIKGRLAIVEYLVEINQYFGNHLLGKSSINRAKVRYLTSWVEDDFYENVVKIILYEKFLKNFDNLVNREPNSNLLRDAEYALKKYLIYIQSILEKSEYFGGEFISLADFSLASNISILDYFDLIEWNINLKRLKHWYLIIKSRPNFKLLLKMKFSGFKQSKQYALIDF
jgi:glutathione S-transferase